MASRAFETAMAGGVPKIATAEDGEFGRNLSKIGKIIMDGRALTMPMNRFSARTGDTGHGYRKLKIAGSIADGGLQVSDPRQVIDGAVDDASKVPLELACNELINIFCEDTEIKEKYEKNKTELIKSEDRLLEARMRVVDSLINEIFGIGIDGFDVEAFVNMMKSQRESFTQIFGQDLEEDEFLSDLNLGLGVSKKFIEVITDSANKESAIEKLKLVFKEDLNPVSDNLMLLRSLGLRALYRAINS